MGGNREVGVVGASAEGKFVLDYMGTAMMDSRCHYAKEMIPWIIAEILRFSATTQVLLSIKDGRLSCLSLKGANAIFDSHVSDCVHSFPVTSVSSTNCEFPSTSSPSPFALLNAPRNEGRKWFIIIFKANDIYQHCRLFSASCKAQVSEVFSTMKESKSLSVQTSVTPPGAGSRGGTLPSSSSASLPVGTNISQLSPISPESISFEVLYVGKLRMSSKIAPSSFIDEALDKFQSHEIEKRRDSIISISSSAGAVGDSRRSSSQESNDPLSLSAETLLLLNNNKTAPEISISNPEDLPNVFSSYPELSSSSSENCSSLGSSLISVTGEGGGEGGSSKSVSPMREIHPLCSIGSAIVKSSIPHPLQDIVFLGVGGKERSRNPSGDACLVKSISLPLPVEPMRSRALSTGAAPREQVLENNHTGKVHYNRTMILIVGRSEMKIISPDAKTLLFAKHFRDIYQSSQGKENKEYFGFICREAVGSSYGSPRQQVQFLTSSSSSSSKSGAYVAYVFRCQSPSVANDILKVLKQASVVSQETLGKERTLQSCDHCPMVWYRQLCAEVDGLSSDERIQLVILKHMNVLLEEDRQSILAKFQGAEPQSTQEQNELLMMLLRVHCEAKQVKHIHDTTENRHEFLNQFLGGGEIFTNAKRSISNSFQHFIKRKGRDGPTLRDSHILQQQHQLMPSQETVEEEEQQREPKGDSSAGSDSGSPGPGPHRQRSSTLGALSATQLRQDLKGRRTSFGPSTPTTLQQPSNSNNSTGSSSPMMNLFQKMGSSSHKGHSSSSPSAPSSTARPGSWRHAIFKKVVSPSTPNAGGSRVHPHHSHNHGTPSSSRVLFRPVKRSSTEIRELWKTAINQQIILIRMEKQNVRLRAKQQEADVKRLKLSYMELGNCDTEANDTWDLIISQSAFNPNIKCDVQLLNSALLRGIPKHKRGQVWQFFISQGQLQRADTNPHLANLCHLNLQLTYDQLLRQLTSQQHAILIDLGRTFPTHPYFTSALGSGQLALFNILKAYSLLDTDVGYCQGLSFVAGLLLMHLEEEEAFSVLKYIMFDLGAREHYKPDMHELQVKLYQLTRLIHDQDADLLLLLNHYDVLPSLYAAPWFLTLFASQFSVGFAVRILDVLLLHGVDVIAKFAVVIILDHKKELMQCTGLEQVMDCFKTVVTNISSEKLDKYLRKVLESDWDKQMLTYSVEYSVMNDEAFHAFLSESSTTTSTLTTVTNRKYIERSSQTDPLLASSVSPPVGSSTPSPLQSANNSNIGGGEKHPILGDLIQRQNSEISKLKLEKIELRRDVQTMLQCIHTMQQLAQISSNGRMNMPVPPEVTEIASKYFMKCGTSYAGLLENGCKTSTLAAPGMDKSSSLTTLKLSNNQEVLSPKTSLTINNEMKIPPLRLRTEGDSSDDSCDGLSTSIIDSPLSTTSSTTTGVSSTDNDHATIRSKVDVMLTM